MKYYLAPMEGVTGRVFRQSHLACFAPLDKYFAPFITPNDNGRLSPRDYRELSQEGNQGLFVVPQILTNQAQGFIRTARALKDMGYGEVNLNLGCPSGTVVSKRRGSGFLAYPEELERFLYEIFSRLDMKISVKTRLGKEGEEEFARLLSIYNQYPLEELIIHPRLQKDYYKNFPRIGAFEEGFLHSRNTVCYNGDIFTVSDYEKLKGRYPSLGRVMLGRGLAANPGLAAQLQTGRAVSKEQVQEFSDRMYQGYRDSLLPASGERAVLFKMKELWCYLAFMFPGSKKWEKKIKKAQSLRGYEAAVDSLFRECPFAASSGFGAKGE